jgi:hypothetical protein
VLDEPAAGDRADRDAQAGHRRPRADRLRALLGGEDGVKVDRVEGMISAPPTPMNARLAMSWPPSPDSAASSEPAPNTTRPASSIAAAGGPSPSSA